MGRKDKRKKRRFGGQAMEVPRTREVASVVPLRPSGSPQSRPPRAASDRVAARFEEVRCAMERESSKAALEKAKQLHKELASEESQSLLIDAYAARIRGMLAKDMTVEAKALADLVISRFPEAADRIGCVQRGLAAQTGDMAVLAKPLVDPNVTGQERKEAEQAIRRGLVDLSALAGCSVLPSDHRLRKAAASLDGAFAAVTSGPVEEASIGLADVSHRSPLAAWKSLIRAIWHLYHNRDADCRRFLEILGEDAVPSRAAAVVRSVLEESWDEHLTHAGRSLVGRISGPRIELRMALRALDEAFARRDLRGLYRQIHEAVSLCERTCPQILTRLKQHISVKASMAHCPPERVIAAMGGPPVHNAYFLRLFARGIETTGDHFGACVLWERFRNAAVREGLFAADAQQNALLYMHMAELLRRVPPEDLEQLQDEYLDGLSADDDFYDEDGYRASRRPPEQPDTSFLFPDRLYQRACAIRSDAEIYRQWLDHAQSAQWPNRKPDDIASRWSAAFPQDRRPLLHLAQSAEQRNAFDKALKYIERAERLGGVDPKVKRARLRLLVAKAVRHLKQRKLHLVDKDFAQIEQLPQATEKDRPAFLVSLRWVHAMLGDDSVEAARLHSQVQNLLGSEVAAHVLLASVARECEYASTETDNLVKQLSAFRGKEIAGVIVRTCPIGRDMNIKVLLSAKWESLLKKWFKRSDCGLDEAGLLTMAGAALTADWREVAYYCSGHGLRHNGSAQARFMLLRGRSLPDSADARRQKCFSAALGLAKRVRDMDLVAEITEAVRADLAPWESWGPFGPGVVDLNDSGVNREDFRRAIEDELRQSAYPKESWSPFFGKGRRKESVRECQCPSCRRARGEAGGYGGSAKPKPRQRPGRDLDERYLFEDMFDEQDNDDGPPGASSEAEMLDQAKEALSELSGMPPAVVELMAEVARLNGGRIPQSEKEIERVVARNPQLQQTLEIAMLQSMLEGGPDALDDLDFKDVDDFEEDTGSWPFPPRSRRRGRKKRKRGR